MRVARVARVASSALLALIAGACSANGRSDPRPTSGSAATQQPSAAATRVTMDIKYQDLPDDRWRHAAEIVVAAWRESLAQDGVTQVVVRPWKSPAGELVPYLLLVEATQPDGSPGSRTAAAVWNDKLANGGGAAAATGFLAAAGFPATHVSLGHLLELFYLTGALDLSWFRPPSSVGWEGVARPFLGTDLTPALDYTKAGAVLHLYRGVGVGSGGGHAPSGGFTAPEAERLDVTFDAKAHFTTAVLRRDPATGTWHPVR